MEMNKKEYLAIGFKIRKEVNNQILLNMKLELAKLENSLENSFTIQVLKQEIIKTETRNKLFDEILKALELRGKNKRLEAVLEVIKKYN